MKNLGLILIVIGIVLMSIVAYNMIGEKNRVKSPIPDEKGIKVIFVTPTK